MYKVTGTIPTPQYDPEHPFFTHHESTAPKGKIHDNGRAGRKVSVTTEAEKRAEELATSMASKGLFLDVTIEEVTK